MTHPPTGRYDDAILRIATVAVRIFVILLWVAIAGLAIAIPSLFVWQDRVMAELIRQGAEGNAMTLSVAVIAILVAAAFTLFLATRFFGKILKMIATVSDDPFVPENAVRLRAMAWLLLAIEVLSFAIGTFAHLMLKNDGKFEMSFTGVLAVLLLFVLARVFAHGTAMREDIEGTV